MRAIRGALFAIGKLTTVLFAVAFALGLGSVASAAPPVFNGRTVTAGMPAFNATFYGAKGDGTTDDTTAIQNALNATCPTPGGQAIGYVYLQAGNYKITSTLNIQCSDEGIRGSGIMVPTLVATNGVTTLTWAGSTGGTMVLAAAPAGSGSSNPYGNLGDDFVENLKLASGNGVSGSTGAAYGFEVKGVWHARMSHVACDGFTGYCFYPTYDTQFNVPGSGWSTMDNVYGEDFTGGLVWYDGSYGNFIYNTKFTFSNGTAIRIGGGANTSLDESDGNTFVGLNLDEGSGGTGTAMLFDCDSQNSVVYGMALSPVVVRGTTSCTGKGGPSVDNAIFGDGSYDDVGVAATQPTVEAGGGLFVQRVSGATYNYSGPSAGTAADAGTQYWGPAPGPSASPPPNVHGSQYIWHVEGQAGTSTGQDFAAVASRTGSTNFTVIGTQPFACGGVNGKVWSIVDATASGNVLTNGTACLAIGTTGTVGVLGLEVNSVTVAPAKGNASCSMTSQTNCTVTATIPSGDRCTVSYDSGTSGIAASALQPAEISILGTTLTLIATTNVASTGTVQMDYLCF